MSRRADRSPRPSGRGGRQIQKICKRAEMSLPGPDFVRHRLLKKLDDTEIGPLLHEFGLLGED